MFMLYNKTLVSKWLLPRETSVLFPLNLDVSLDFVSGNIKILGKQNMFPSWAVIKCKLIRLITIVKNLD